MTPPAARVLEDRRALIIGDDELGAGIALRLERAGAIVQLTAADQPATAAAGQGPLDILVLNLLPAAAPAPLDAIAAQSLEAALSTVTRAAQLMQACFPQLRRRGGRILLIGHRYGESVNEGLAAYNAAAWALIGLTRSAAVDWGQYQITTNLILPLAATRELQSAHEQRPRVIDLLISQLPLRRVGDPADDVGGAVVFLASEDAGFINGEIVHADGGQHVAGAVLNPARFATHL